MAGEKVAKKVKIGFEEKVEETKKRKLRLKS